MQKVSTSEIDLFILYGSAASEAMRDYPCNYFKTPSCTGVIAYRIEFNCAIILGDPLCPSSELVELTQAFHNFCQESDLNIIYIAVTENFARVVQEYCQILIEITEEFIFDPQIDYTQKSHRLQHRVDKAIKHGLTFHEYIPFDQEIENSLLEIGTQWQKARKELSFHLGHLNFFENTQGKRWFYIKDGNSITSMAMLCQLEAQKGWLLKFFFTMPNAFPDTSEFLMISLLTTLKNENCHFLTKGIMPIDSIGEIKGLGYRTQLVKYIYNAINFIFKFKKHKQYWLRYHPEKIPAYLLFGKSKIGLNEIKALFKVFKVD